MQLAAAQRWAAAGGQLNALRYDHDNGCPWDRELCRETALHNSHAHVVD